MKIIEAAADVIVDLRDFVFQIWLQFLTVVVFAGLVFETGSVFYSGKSNGYALLQE
jgi:hypothetical protein